MIWTICVEESVSSQKKLLKDILTLEIKQFGSVLHVWLVVSRYCVGCLSFTIKQSCYDIEYFCHCDLRRRRISVRVNRRSSSVTTFFFSLFVLPEQHLSCSSHYSIAKLATFWVFPIPCPGQLSHRGSSSLGASENLWTELQWLRGLNPFSTMWCSWFLGRVESKRFLVDSKASTMHASFVFLLDSVIPLAAVACSSLKAFFVPILQGKTTSIDISNFFPYVFLMASMKQMHLRFRALSSFGFSMVHSCFCFFVAAGKIPEKNSGHKFCGLVVAWIFVSRLPDTNILEVSRLILKLRESCPWIWQISIHVDVPMCVCSPFWRQYILLSGRRDELEVLCDDDKGSLLRLTRSHCGLQRHLLFLSVETSPSFLEVLPSDLHPSQVDPALEWVLGLHDPWQTVLTVPSAIGTKNLPPFFGQDGKLTLLLPCSSKSIDAPEPTTNSRSSVFSKRCWHYACFVWRVERRLILVFELIDIFTNSRASLLGHLSCCKVSSCSFFHFGAQGLRSWGSHFCIPCDGPFLFRIFTCRIVVFENLTAWFAARRIDLFWGLSWDTQPNCIDSFC